MRKPLALTAAILLSALLCPPGACLVAAADDSQEEEIAPGHAECLKTALFNGYGFERSHAVCMTRSAGWWLGRKEQEGRRTAAFCRKSADSDMCLQRLKEILSTAEEGIKGAMLVHNNFGRGNDFSQFSAAARTVELCREAVAGMKALVDGGDE